MFDTRYIKHLENEITYLRELVKELNDKLMAQSDALGKYESYKLTQGDAEPVKVMNELTGQIEALEPLNEEEEKQKQDALEELLQLESDARVVGF